MEALLYFLLKIQQFDFCSYLLAQPHNTCTKNTMVSFFRIKR